MTYRPHVDGLRAIAVLAVVFFHAGFESFGGGFVGVDVFFVISGFLITKMIVVQEHRFSLIRFYERRARRILPALVIVVVFCSVVAYVLFMPKEFAAFGKSVAATALLSSNMLFWSETGYFDAPPELKPLLHTWSVAVEEQFYLLYPLLLILCRRYLGGRWILLLLPACLLSFAASIWMTRRTPEAAFYLAPSRAWEFLLGCLLAVEAIPRLSNRLWREGLSLFGIALIAWSVFTFSQYMLFPGLNALVPCLGAAILIAVAGDKDTVVGRILASGPLVFIGLISYSLYLWHWPIFVFARYIVMDQLSLQTQIILLLITLPLSYFSWRYVEQPVRRGLYWRGRRLFIGSVVTALTAVCFGVLVGLSSGMPGRIAPEILALEKVLHDRRDCHFVTSERVDAGDLCIRGAPNTTPTFVLVGDSHADALSPGVFAGAERAGTSGYQFTAPGWRPLPGVQVLKQPLTDKFIDFMQKHPSLRLVVVTGFWWLQAEGTGNGSPKLFKDDRYDGSGLAYNKVSFRRGLEKLINTFPGRQFVIVEDVPWGPEFAIANLARALHFREVLGLANDRWSTTNSGILRHRYEEQLASYRPILEYAAGAPNVSILSLINQLCDNQLCYGMRDGVPLYRDTSHLSPTGSMLFADTFTHVFAKRVGAAR